MKMSQRRKMWLQIAIAYGTPRTKRTSFQKSLTVAGLCNATAETIGFHSSRRMMLKISRALRIRTMYPHPLAHKKSRLYWWPLPDDASRIVFASLMAAMTDKEFRHLVR
jgi:hypothetical protein